ncbi:MAG TPA: 50S ribosomal protein L2 [Candidatus Nanoarchaeia archaeon]|uniref:Ribosomal protein L2, large subunit ribosomal protein L2 n=1 Tax=uncultured archaeon Rifle_16ft_4_minimus_37913 TaxID=1665152 RepID=A0A0H4T697_9ARCH|nr:50S ribosomal protein L2P [uncultured archaeon]AKQ03271.1 ribosomal protein L2, large subunit ribosomal protein L2 [uncultured archaeon Rifle_16ft_4_minimus_37913]HKZ34211.1 50S ribosomal protein L2 [Candidatus Nanoarchaeia archaeon]
MGKRIISQARGHGSGTYRVRGKAFRVRPRYPVDLLGEGIVIRMLNSPGHTAPLAKIKYEKGIFFMPAFKGMIEGQKINLGMEGDAKPGNVMRLKDIPVKSSVYNIESRPGDGGIFIRSGGSSGMINRISETGVFVLMPSRKEKEFNPKCRATIGVIAGSGRQEKPIMKAGKRYHMKRAKGKKWPRTSAVKMNVVDHPFGSGRGKNPKSKIPKRNAPPGKKVGLLRPRRTGHVK